MLRVLLQQRFTTGIAVGGCFRVQIAQWVKSADPRCIECVKLLEQFWLFGAFHRVIVAKIAQRVDLDLLSRRGDQRNTALFVNEVVEGRRCILRGDCKTIIAVLVGYRRVNHWNTFGRDHLQIDRVFVDPGEGSRYVGFVFLSAWSSHYGHCWQ